MNLTLETPITYQQLCYELQLSPKRSGRNRELQIEKLKEEYDLIKLPNEYNKYIIHRELTKEEKQSIQDTKHYTSYITNLLLNLFAKDNNPTCTYTIRELRENTGMVNNVYFPVKYNKASVTINPPSNYTGNIMSTKEEWLDISDKMDEAILIYALNKLKKKGLIEYYYTYKLYKIIPQKENEEVYYPPHVLTEEELSEFLQVQSDTLKELNLNSKQQLHFCPNNIKNQYYNTMNSYIQSKGFTNYARAITIIKPKELDKLVGYFIENFNVLQVQKYLKSKRFQTIPPFVHNALVNQLIQIK